MLQTPHKHNKQKLRTSKRFVVDIDFCEIVEDVVPITEPARLSRD